MGFSTKTSFYWTNSGRSLPDLFSLLHLLQFSSKTVNGFHCKTWLTIHIALAKRHAHWVVRKICYNTTPQRECCIYFGIMYHQVQMWLYFTPWLLSKLKKKKCIHNMCFCMNNTPDKNKEKEIYSSSKKTLHALHSLPISGSLLHEVLTVWWTSQ